jgi:hypothetical protein
VLTYAPKFHNVTYMSATPIEREYILDELQNMPMVDLV